MTGDINYAKLRHIKGGDRYFPKTMVTIIIHRPEETKFVFTKRI